MKIRKLVLKKFLSTILVENKKLEKTISILSDVDKKLIEKIPKKYQLFILTKKTEEESISQTWKLVQIFEKKKDALKNKGNSTDINSYDSSSHLRLALESLGESNQEKKTRVVEKETSYIFSDNEHIVVMPHTTESSVHWGRETTWCTAATQSANLFFSYVGKKDSDIILYYVIKKKGNPKENPQDKLSIATKSGKIILRGDNGGLSVDASNNGLTHKSLKEILGQKKDIILNKIVDHSKQVGEKHPAKEHMKALSNNWKKIEKHIKEMDKFQKDDFLRNAIEYTENSTVLHNISFFEEDPYDEEMGGHPFDRPNHILNRVLNNEHTKEETIIKILSSAKKRRDAGFNHEIDILYGIKNKNFSTTEAIKLVLSKETDVYTRSKIAEAFELPEDVFSKLVKENNKDVLVGMSKNKNTSKNIVEALIAKKSKNINLNLLSHPLFEESSLREIIEDPTSDSDSLHSVMINKKLTDSLKLLFLKNIKKDFYEKNSWGDAFAVLKDQSGEQSKEVLSLMIELAENLYENNKYNKSLSWISSKISYDTPDIDQLLYRLVFHKSRSVRIAAIDNKKIKKFIEKMHPQIEKFNKEKNNLYQIASSEKTSYDILRELSKKGDFDIKLAILKNKKVFCDVRDNIQEIKKLVNFKEDIARILDTLVDENEKAFNPYIEHHPFLSEYAAETLSKSNIRGTRVAIAANSSTSARILKKMLEVEKDPSIVSLILSNSNLPIDFSIKHFYDRNSTLDSFESLKSLATFLSNKKIDIDFLRKAFVKVSEVIQKNKSQINQLSSISVSVMTKIIKHNSTDADLINKIAESHLDILNIAEAIASREITPLPILRKIMKKFPKAHDVLSSNTGIDDEMFFDLYEKFKNNVYSTSRLLHNKSIPHSLIDKILEEASEKNKENYQKIVSEEHPEYSGFKEEKELYEFWSKII